MGSSEISMDQWFRALRLPMTWNQFHQLPRNSAYKYEYVDQQAWLTPRPKTFHALLDLQPTEPIRKVDAPWSVVIRPLKDSDWDRLVHPFAGAFSRVQPFGSLSDEQRREAARQMLHKTRTGGDGPLVKRACFVAATAGDKDLVGGILITLIPSCDLATTWIPHHGPEPMPADAVRRRLGQPHLTWVFVAALLAGYGVGTALLSNAVARLLDLGYRRLASTFLLGNDWSVLWHWRNGFRLLSHPGSLRRMRQEIRQIPEALKRRRQK
jgi:GNAT superfamily N-acetyltransferase